MTFSRTNFKTVEKALSVQSAIQQVAQNCIDERESETAKNLCEVSDLGHLKENKLSRNEAQLVQNENTQLGGLVKLEVILIPILIEIERKYING